MNSGEKLMNETKLPLLIGIGSRIRKSPYFDSTIKYGVTGFTIYNRMYLPTAFSNPNEGPVHTSEDLLYLFKVTYWHLLIVRSVSWQNYAR